MKRVYQGRSWKGKEAGPSYREMAVVLPLPVLEAVEEFTERDRRYDKFYSVFKKFGAVVDLRPLKGKKFG